VFLAEKRRLRRGGSLRLAGKENQYPNPGVFVEYRVWRDIPAVVHGSHSATLAIGLVLSKRDEVFLAHDPVAPHSDEFLN
jgi:hypothetical protein